MSPPQVTKLFERRNNHPYNLRHNIEFSQSFVNLYPVELKVSHI